MSGLEILTHPWSPLEPKAFELQDCSTPLLPVITTIITLLACGKATDESPNEGWNMCRFLIAFRVFNSTEANNFGISPGSGMGVSLSRALMPTSTTYLHWHDQNLVPTRVLPRARFLFGSHSKKPAWSDHQTEINNDESSSEDVTWSPRLCSQRSGLLSTPYSVLCDCYLYPMFVVPSPYRMRPCGCGADMQHESPTRF